MFYPVKHKLRKVLNLNNYYTVSPHISMGLNLELLSISMRLFKLLSPETAAEMRQINADSFVKMKGIRNELLIAIDKIKNFELTVNDFISVTNGVAELQSFGDVITDKVLDAWNKTLNK